MQTSTTLQAVPAALVRNMGADLAHKADICTKVLAEAKKLAIAGQRETSVGPLLLRAAELLDDVDELLLPLHPIRNADEFALAAKLHRDLEHVQAALTASRREALYAAKTTGKR